MGRFYKTDKPTFVDDIIYQAPHQLMLNALKTQDAAFDKQQKDLDAFDTMGDLLDFVDNLKLFTSTIIKLSFFSLLLQKISHLSVGLSTRI